MKPAALRIIAGCAMAIACACKGGWSDGSPVSHISADSAIIERVRQQYSAVERESPRFKRVERTLTGYSTDGGGLVAFYNDTALRKIESLLLNRAGRTTQTMYYWNGGLVFVNRMAERFNRPRSGIVASAGKELFFFADGKLVRWVGEDGQLLRVDDAAARAQSAELLRLSRDFAQVAQRPPRR